MKPRILATLVLSLAACSGGGDSAAPCGLNRLVGPSVLLSEFATPGQTLSAPPPEVPEQIVVRLVAGPAYSAILGRADTQLVVGVNGTLPENVTPGFGVLVVNPEGASLGVLLYESTPVDGAPWIGTVTAGSFVIPLIGIQLDPTRVEDPRCPLFPDSLTQ
jgi:hypothetical protein